MQVVGAVGHLLEDWNRQIPSASSCYRLSLGAVTSSQEVIPHTAVGARVTMRHFIIQFTTRESTYAQFALRSDLHSSSGRYTIVSATQVCCHILDVDGVESNRKLPSPNSK